MNKPPSRPPFINATEIIQNLLAENRRLVEIILKLTVPGYNQGVLHQDVQFASAPLHYNEDEEDAMWAEQEGIMSKEEMEGILKGVGYTNSEIVEVE